MLLFVTHLSEIWQDGSFFCEEYVDYAAYVNDDVFIYLWLTFLKHGRMAHSSVKTMWITLRLVTCVSLAHRAITGYEYITFVRVIVSQGMSTLHLCA